MSDKPTLARGAKLTQETWADFVARLRHDCVGEEVDQHCTENAVFLVQRRVWVSMPESCPGTIRVYTDGDDESLEEFFSDLEPEKQAELDEALDGSFLEADAYHQHEALERLHPDAELNFVHEGWEFVCQHFTRDAAEAFIEHKKHNYPDGLRVYVDATYYSWELNSIKAAILDGRIGLLQPQQSITHAS